MKIRAELRRQRTPLWPQENLVDKVLELPSVPFATLLMQPLDRYDFIEQNRVEPHQGDGFTHCLLVLSDDRMDGVLIQCGSNGHAMYTAYVAGAKDVVQAKLDRAADFIIRQGIERTDSGSWRVHRNELEDKLGVFICEGNGLDIMLKDALERRPEVASVDMANGVIETTFHPEFCARFHNSTSEEKPNIRLRDILPLLTGGGLTFLTHEEADTSVLAENLRELTPTGRENHAALLNARVSEISSGPEGTEVVLADVDPRELARFNMACEAHQEAEQAMGPTM